MRRPPRRDNRIRQTGRPPSVGRCARAVPGGVLLANLLAFTGAAPTSTTAPATAPATTQAAGERGARLAALEAEFGRPIVTLPDDVERTLRIRGRVVAPAGAAIPTVTIESAALGRINPPGRRSPTPATAVAADGAFEATVPWGTVTAVVQAPGHAPSAATLPQPPADGSGGVDAIPPATLTLGPAAFDVPIRVVDAEGKPVAGATLDVTLGVPEGDRTVSVPARQWRGDNGATIDADGKAVLAEAADGMGLAVSVRRPGVPADGPVAAHGSFTLSPADVAKASPTLTLPMLAITTGRVVDAATLEPIPNATLRVLRDQSVVGGGVFLPTPRRAEPANAPTTFPADAGGTFETDRLADGTAYDLIVSADGHGCEVAHDVRGGDGDVVVKLGPPRPVRVALRAGPDGWRPATLDVTQQYRIASSTWSATTPLPIEWSGDRGTATLADPLRGRPRFQLPGNALDLTVEATSGGTAAPAEVRLPARPAGVADPAAEAAETTSPTSGPASQPARREAVVRLHAADGEVPSRGTVTAAIRDPLDARFIMQNLARPIRDGEARLTLPVGTRLSGFWPRAPDFWFAQPRQPALPPAGVVPEGDGPLVFDVDAYPAGAITGRVVEADGKPATGGYVSFETITAAPGTAGGRAAINSYEGAGVSRAGRFLRASLPLGGTYRAVASNDGRVARGEPVTIDAAHPIAETVLRYGPSQTLEVHVTAPDGGPAVGRRVQLQITVRTSNNSTSTSSRTAYTDAEGRARIDKLAAPAKDDAPSQPANPNNPFDGDRQKSIAFSLSVATVGEEVTLRSRDVDPALGPVTVRLRDGISARGRVLDVGTGRPIRDALVRLAPEDPSVPQGSEAPAGASATTDLTGEFVLHGVDPGRYRVEVDNTYPPGSVVDRDANGRVVNVRQSAGTESVQIVPGAQLELRRVPG